MSEDALMVGVLLVLPVIGLIGGLVHGIYKTVGRQRMMELAQRERIAALERGVDPGQLPPILPPQAALMDSEMTFEQTQLRRSQSLKIIGVLSLTLGIGIGLPALLIQTVPDGWIMVGVILVAIGCGFLISGRIVTVNGRNRHLSGPSS
jgi:hypothetical protein